MTNKIVKLVGFLTMLIAIQAITACENDAFANSENSNTVKKVSLCLWCTKEAIRKQAMKHTPIGSDAGMVEKFIVDKLNFKSLMTPKYDESKGVRRLDSEEPVFYNYVGVHSMKVFLGEVPAIGTIFLLNKAVFISWAFDDKNKLIEIFVDSHRRK